LGAYLYVLQHPLPQLSPSHAPQLFLCLTLCLDFLSYSLPLPRPSGHDTLHWRLHATMDVDEHFFIEPPSIYDFQPPAGAESPELIAGESHNNKSSAHVEQNNVIVDGGPDKRVENKDSNVGAQPPCEKLEIAPCKCASVT